VRLILERALVIAEQLQQAGKFTSHEQKDWVGDFRRRLKELK
jgi:hypothetical protein